MRVALTEVLLYALFIYFYIIFSPAYARGNQRPNSKYRPNCWTEDPNDQPPPIPDYEQQENTSTR